MSLLEEVYASAPAGSLIIPSLEVNVPGQAPVRICCGFEDQMLGTETGFYMFEAGSLSISLPNKNATGLQSLSFGVANVNGDVQRKVDAALEADGEVIITYREYLESDKSAPARRPYVMTLRGGTFERGEVQFEAGYYDTLNTAWPRERYTAENSPGIRYA